LPGNLAAAGFFMSRKADPFKIGVFVAAGLVVLVAALILLGSGRYFRHQVPYILYFSDSVNGLAVGSPVKFKGVSIGTVKRIGVALDPKRGIQHIPVVVEIDRDLIQSAFEEPLDIGQRTFVDSQVALGLRASLEVESFLTGRLYVQFDYYTNALPARFVQEHGAHVEIPTISTGLSEFLKSLERVDLAGLSRRVNELLDKVSGIVQTARVGDVSERLIRTLDSVEELVRSPEVRETVRSLGQASGEARQALADLRLEIRPVAGGLTNLTSQTARSMAALQTVLEEMRSLLNPESPLVGDVSRALEEFGDAARSVRQLADLLERNPQALLTGRRPAAAKP
jgi:paraquat-inducible protein B